MRIGLKGQVRKTWVPKGYKYVERCQNQYKWRYLFLVVDVINGRFYWHWLENMKADSFVEPLKALQNSSIEAMIWDGASSHRSAKVKEIELAQIIQPPYSPELNPAERVFEAIRAEIEGKCYSQITDKINKIENWLTHMNNEPEKIRSLCGFSWIQRTLAQTLEIVPYQTE